MNQPTIVVYDDDGRVLGVDPPEVMGGVMRDGLTYRWLVEPRPNRFDVDAWIDVVWSTV